MPESHARDIIRLSLPADRDLRRVVEVAVAVVGRRVGVGDAEVQVLRSAGGDAFDEVAATAGGERVEVEVEAEDRQLVARIRAGAVDRTIRAPARPPG
jgi:hypothetical protein